MAYLTSDQLANVGFKSYGKNVKISEDARIYDPEKISIGSNVRIDDFCVISGKVTIGDFCHVTPMCLIAGGEPGVNLGDYVTLAYGVKIFSQSDDYSGETMTNSLISKKYKNEIFSSIKVESYSIIGSNSVVMPGANLGEGVAVGASSLVVSPLEGWAIYAGSPVHKLKERSKKLLTLSAQHQKELNQ